MPSIDGQHYYSEEYYRGNMENGSGINVLDIEALSIARKAMESRIKWILSRRRATRFLDIGCGIGLLVEAAVRQGLHANGVDVSAFAIEYGSGELGIQGLKQGSFQDVLGADCRYDVIYLNHVIEHVFAPNQFVSDCVQFLAPGGWLILEAPDIDSTEARLAGKDWLFILPEHLYYFNTTTLPALVKKNGLNVRFVEKIIGSPGILNAAFKSEKRARNFHERWLKNNAAQVLIHWVRKVYGRVGQKTAADYKFIKVVAERDAK